MHTCTHKNTHTHTHTFFSHLALANSADSFVQIALIKPSVIF